MHGPCSYFGSHSRVYLYHTDHSKQAQNTASHNMKIDQNLSGRDTPMRGHPVAYSEERTPCGILRGEDTLWHTPRRGHPVAYSEERTPCGILRGEDTLWHTPRRGHPVAYMYVITQLILRKLVLSSQSSWTCDEGTPVISGHYLASWGVPGRQVLLYRGVPWRQALLYRGSPEDRFYCCRYTIKIIMAKLHIYSHETWKRHVFASYRF